MDSQDRRAVSKLTRILRKITKIIQLIPFVFLAVYSLGAFTESRLSEELLCLRDSMISVSPAITAGFLFFSRLLELCKWHKIACIIPLGTPAADYIDCYVYQFTQNEVVMLNILFGILSTVFLILAKNHFFNGRKRTDTANA